MDNLIRHQSLRNNYSKRWNSQNINSPWGTDITLKQNHITIKVYMLKRINLQWRLFEIDMEQCSLSNAGYPESKRGDVISCTHARFGAFKIQSFNLANYFSLIIIRIY